MPNWCVTNWRIVGSHKSVQEFCDTVNDLPNRPDAMENGFGKYFLGNLAAALGCEVSVEHDNLRGTIDTDPGLYAALCFPHSEEQTKLVPEPYEDKFSVAFSTSSAWDRPYWLEDYIAEHFDDYGFSSTDEFGNFHTVHNIQLFPYIYSVEGEEWGEFRLGEEQRLLDHVSKVSGIQFNPVSNAEELCTEIDKYREELEDKEIYVIISEVE